MVTKDTFAQPPRRELWLDELRLPRFAEILEQARDPVQREDALQARFRGKRPAAAVRGVIKKWGDDPDTWAHILLIGEFLYGKKSSAILDVVRSHAGELAPEAGFAARDRVGLLFDLYAAEPGRLLDVDVCHKWHQRRRAVFTIAEDRGHVYKVQSDVDWSGAVRAVLMRLGAERGWTHADLALCVVVSRSSEGGVLLALREPGTMGTVRVDKSRVEAGSADDWMMLRFHTHGTRVDVTSRDVAAAHRLADAIATEIAGRAIRYVPLMPSASDDQMLALYNRLLDPEDGAVPLLEVMAEAPGLGQDSQLSLVCGGGRVEKSTTVLRNDYQFAHAWTAVRRVKVLFEDKWRMTVNFPDVLTGERVLTYSDLDRDKDVARRFEDHVLDTFGIRIVPKAVAPRRIGRRPKFAGPPLADVDVLVRVLRSRIEDATEEDVAVLKRLHERGMLTFTAQRRVRCSTAAGHTGRPEGLDCTGIVTWAWAARTDDEFLDEDDGLVRCDGPEDHAWSPRRDRLDGVAWVDVRLREEAIWAECVHLLRDLSPTPLDQGVVLLPGPRPVQLVYVPLVLGTTLLDAGGLGALPAVFLDHRAPTTCAAGVVSTAALLAGSPAVVQDAMKHARRDWPHPSAPLAADVAAPPAAAQLVSESIEMKEERPHSGGRRQVIVFAGLTYPVRDVGPHMLLTVLARAAKQAHPDPPAGMTVQKIQAACKALGFPEPSEDRVRQWESRVRRALEKKWGRATASSLLVKPKGTFVLSLGARVVPRGF